MTILGYDCFYASARAIDRAAWDKMVAWVVFDASRLNQRLALRYLDARPAGVLRMVMVGGIYKMMFKLGIEGVSKDGCGARLKAVASTMKKTMATSFEDNPLYGRACLAVVLEFGCCPVLGPKLLEEGLAQWVMNAAWREVQVEGRLMGDFWETMMT